MHNSALKRSARIWKIPESISCPELSRFTSTVFSPPPHSKFIVSVCMWMGGGVAFRASTTLMDIWACPKVIKVSKLPANSHYNHVNR